VAALANSAWIKSFAAAEAPLVAMDDANEVTLSVVAPNVVWRRSLRIWELWITELRVKGHFNLG